MRKTGFLRRGRLLVIALVVGALALGISAPSRAAHAASAHQTWNVTVGVQSANGAIAGMIFTPSDVFVKAGDTIVWSVGSPEIHTVSFGPPPGNNFGAIVTPAGGPSFTGTGFYNSGIMSTVPGVFPGEVQQYALAINAPVGNYTFYCLVHGPMMAQVVHVIADDTAYPFSQANYDSQAAQQRAHVIAQGWQAYAQTISNLAPNTVSVGSSVDSGQADIMRFLRPNTSIKVGESVTFTNVTTAPHTVTIGQELSEDPYGDLNNVKLGDNVNSGIFGAAFGRPSVTLRFTQPGVYHFFCELHDFMGMVGTITVTP